MKITTNEKLNISAIICAAGKGTRAGFEKNKLLMPLNGTTDGYNGRTIPDLVYKCSDIR